MGNGKHRRHAFLMAVALLGASLAVAFAQPTVAELRAVTQLEPENVEAWVNLGNAYLEDERFEQAKDAFLEAIALEYRHGDAHFGLGLAEFGRGDLQAALFAFNEVTRLYPERFDGHYNRGVTLSRLDRPQDAAEAFREAAAQAEPEASAKEQSDAYVALASQLSRAANFAAAADAYGQAIELEPENVNDLRYLRAEALYRAGAGLEALPELTELEAETSDYRVNALIADIYVNQGQVDYALRALERGVRMAREAGDSRMEASLLVKLGLLQRQLGRDAEAAASFERAADLDQSSWQALYNLGVSYLEAGQAATAAQSLQRAAQISGAGGQVQLALASAYDQLGQPQEAANSARAAINDLAGDQELVSQARLILGRALYQQGEYLQAENVLTQVVESRPSDPQAQLWAGLAAYQQGNYQQAAQFYERAVQLAPNDTTARANLGAAYLATQRFADAQAVFELLVQQNPQDAESHYNLGWALMSQNRRAAAQEAWQQAQQLGYTPAAQALAEHF